MHESCMQDPHLKYSCRLGKQTLEASSVVKDLCHMSIYPSAFLFLSGLDSSGSFASLCSMQKLLQLLQAGVYFINVRPCIC